MNRIGNQSDTNTSVSKANVHVNVFLLALTMVAFPVMKYAVRFQGSSAALELLSSAIAYPLAIYLYRGIPSAMFTRHARWLGIPAALGLPIAFRYHISGEMITPSTEWLLLLGASVLTGVVASRWREPMKAYLAGLVCLLTGLSVMLWPHWVRIIDNGPALITYMMTDVRSSLLGMGFGDATVNSVIDWGYAAGFWIIRLVPVTMLMSVVTQYSLGYLWFGTRDRRDGVTVVDIPPFHAWRMPRWTLAVLGAACVATTFFVQGVSIAADNALVGLSIYYCVCGLSLIQALTMRWRWPKALRVVAYIALGVTGVFGYVVAVVLGILDSAVKFRREVPSTAR